MESKEASLWVSHRALQKIAKFLEGKRIAKVFLEVDDDKTVKVTAHKHAKNITYVLSARINSTQVVATVKKTIYL